MCVNVKHIFIYMKNFILFLILSLSLNANELFVYNNTNDAVGENVVGDKVVETTLEIGKTYSLKNNLSITTSTNQTVIYALSSKTFVEQRAESSVYFNEFEQTFQNDFKNPENVIVKESLANFSVSQGQLFVLQRDENVNATVMTTLALVNFQNAKFFLKTDPKYTAVYVYDGNVTVLETKGKKAKVIEAGNVLVVTPAPAFVSPKMTPRRYHTMTETTVDELNIGEEQDIEKLFTDLQYSLDNTIFVNYGTDIFGIKFSKRN